jgi:Asp-tRNA(Asn)/Glu-tRNA(Gln) amidotransferase A subunit family amidase
MTELINLCGLPATEARRLIGERKLSPVDLLEACIAQIETVNPRINAVVTKSYERARLEAKEAEQAVAEGRSLGLLHGLPALIKDLNETKDIRTTFASPLYKDNVPTSDDPVVTRLRQQGAIIVGKTNTPEFGVGSNTINRVFGATCNPFLLDRTSGGSSGGAGAALATNMVPIANGSDSAASIRNPAAFCGVVGLRPSPGLVASSSRKMGLSTNGVEGPMGRTVADVALLLAAMARYDSRDMMSRPVDTSIFTSLRSVDVSGLKVAVSEDLGFAPVDQVVRQIFRERLRIFSSAFAACDEAEINMTGAEEAYMGVRGLHLLASHYTKYEEHGNALDKNLVWNLEDALKTDPITYSRALTEQTRINQDLQSVFDEYDVLITPAVNVLPFEHSISYPTTLDGRPARHYCEWLSITYAISLIGHPAISLPAGLDPQGTPFGLQVIGARFGDHRLLEIGQALESLLQSHLETRRPLADLASLSL